MKGLPTKPRIHHRPSTPRSRDGCALGLPQKLALTLCNRAICYPLPIVSKRSSGPISRVLCTTPTDTSMPTVVAACHLSTTGVTTGLYRSTLRLGRTALPPHCHGSQGSHAKRSIAGLRELSTSGVHGTYVAIRPVSSYLTFSPLPPLRPQGT